VRLGLGVVALIACARGAAARSAQTSSAPLVRAGTIELPGVDGRIDHLAVDLARERLFLAALGNDSVEVVDLRAGKHLRSLPGASEPQGIAYLADCDRIVVANGGSGACDVYDGATLERTARVEVGADADNVRYDARAKRVYVAFGEGALGVVDAASWKVVERIALTGHPESFQLDAQGKSAWVNVPDAGALVRIDLEARKGVATVRLDEARANFPLAWVPPDSSAPEGRLLVGCRSPAKLLVRDAKSGAKLAALELSGDTDDVFYDARRRRAYAVCGAGSIDVFADDERDGLRALARVASAPGARTGLFVPERERLFVAVPRRDGQRAEVTIFTVQD